MNLDKINLIYTMVIGFPIFYLITSLSLKQKILIDNDFKKKQSFHNKIKSLSGGLSIIITLTLIFYLNNNDLNKIFIFPFLFFLVGFLDDLKIVTSPILRFYIIVLLIIFLVLGEGFYVQDFGITMFQNYFNEVFLIVLTIIGFFLVLNGSNLIDGFNGLLSIHISIISLILFFFVEKNMIVNQSIILNFIFILLIFLYFNLLKQNLFLGDSGAYFLGSLLGIIIINTSNNLDSVSPFFFAIILFYLYFETVFSVFRKIYERKDPFKPDRLHLHMLLYKRLKKKKFKNPNSLNGVLINFIYLILILPSFLFINNNFILFFYFIFLHIVYLSTYRYVREKK